MSKLIILDTGPLGLVTNPKASLVTQDATRKLVSLLSDGVAVAIPEIADYEIRRELLRGDKWEGLNALDALKSQLHYLPITTEAMLKAAEFWAEARKQGRPTADDRSLDADVILAAQAVVAGRDYDEAVIVTTNAAHISRFVTAQEWENIL